jgi:PAS domain S-box-containing protein
MNPYAFESLLAAGFALAMGAFVYGRNPRHILNQLFILICIFLAASAFVEFGYRQARTLQEAVFWKSIDNFWPFIPAILFHFSLVFTERTRVLKRQLSYVLIYAPAFAFFFLEATTDWITGPPVERYWGWSSGAPLESATGMLARTWTALLPAASLVLAAHYIMTTRHKVRKAQAAAVFGGIAIPVLVGMVTEFILPLFKVFVPQYTNQAFILACGPIFYGVWKHQAFGVTPASAADQIVAAMPDVLLLTDPRGRVLYANPAASVLLGRTEMELEGRSAVELIGADPDGGEAKLPGPAGCSNLITSLRAKSGRDIPVSLSVMPLGTGKSESSEGAVWIGRDITGIREAEERIKRYHERLEEGARRCTLGLAASNASYEALFEHSPVPLWVYDLSDVKKYIESLDVPHEQLPEYLKAHPETAAQCIKLARITNANKAALALFGIPDKASMPRTPEALAASPEARLVIANGLGTLAAGKGVFEAEATARTTAGKEKHIALGIMPAPGSEKTLSTVLFTMVDLTERKRMEQERARIEEQLHHAEKLQAIGQLAGGIAHDFNNQLSVIIGAGEKMQEYLPPDSPAKRYVELVVRAAQHSAGIARQLLAFARKGKCQSVPVSVHKLIGEAVSLLEHAVDKRVAIRQALNAANPVTVGDPSQLINALLNLGLNARDAMLDGGVLTFSTSNKSIKPGEQAGAHFNIPPGDYIEIAVSDTGTGIPKEIQDRIFEPFFTTKPSGQGTGMGLPAVYGTVRSHDGFVDFESKVGAGTTFRIYLKPGEQAEYQETVLQPAARITGSASILLAEDEDMLRSFYADVLSDLGYKVKAFPNGARAVDYYREHWKEIDIVMLDMIMPEMNAHQAFHEMRAINPAVKAILLSGYSPDGQVQQLLDEGMRAFIQKPCEVDELARKIAEVVAAK